MAKYQRRYGMLVNLSKCVGCYACQISCKTEYDIPFGNSRCRVETYMSGNYPHIKKCFIPHFCNHCDSAPCIDECTENALQKNQDGVVVLKKDACTGCQMCREKCPYNAIQINSVSGHAEKCDFCDERIQKGLQPVCVMSCMGRALLFGDINDPKSEIAGELAKHKLKILNPEFGTNPSVFYIGKDDFYDSPLKALVISDRKPTRRTRVKRNEEQSGTAVRLCHTSDVMCPSECGITVLVEDGVAKKIYGNPHTLINNGTLCAKGASGLQLTYSPHRIKTPLLRTGQRGEGRWKEITWEEALDVISKKMIEIKSVHGPESVFLDTGDVTDREAFYRLFHAFGTPNIFNHGSICDPNRRWGQGIMLGDERPLPDVQRPVLTRNDDGETYLKTTHDAKLILNIGANPFVATRYNYMSKGIVGAKEDNGCIYIVVDPSHTNSAAHADIWLPIIPGTDAALLAGMLYYIIQHDPEQKYIEHDFLKNYTTGWTEFKDAFLACSEDADPSNNFFFFTSEWTSEKTGISIENIMKVSHLFGSTKPAAIEIGMHGTAHHANGDVTSILSSALCLITGNLDVPGGIVFTDSVKPKRGNQTSGKHFLNMTVSRKIDGAEISGRLSELHKDLFGDYPAAWKGVLADLPQKIRNGIKLKHGVFKNHSYPVKAFIARAGNPVVTAGSTPDWIDAFTMKNGSTLPTSDKAGAGELLNEYGLELIVCIDTHISTTGTYADIILPEAGYLERMGVSDVYTMSPEIALRDQVIRPVHESKTPFEIMIALSDALVKNGDPDVKDRDFGLKYKNEEDFVDEILSEAPGFYNFGDPLPYPDIPEGCMIIGVPENPSAIWGSKTIRQGEPVTVKWMRKNHGVAVWPAGYYRYRKKDGRPSGVYPATGTRKFEFRFSYLEAVNKKFGSGFPTTFYWKDCMWNPKNDSFREISREYPFQLISGRAHYAMTMTAVCTNLGETMTECMRRLNDAFNYNKTDIGAGEFSVPVLAMNTSDGQRLNMSTGDTITLETPYRTRVKGRVFLTEEVIPGVIKTAFGPGGQKAAGMGITNNTSAYTPNINECFDPNNLSPFTGMPGFGDIMVRIVRDSS